MKHKLLSVLIIFILTTASAFAGKFDLMFGFFSFSGTANNKSSKVSGIGVYEGAYLVPFFDHFEANLGYSFAMSKMITGDYSYGPKIGINYYPMNFSSSEKIRLENKTIDVQDFFRPYVGFAFNQRQFQSAKTSYAGLGISIGFEKYINSKFTVKSELKFNSYAGASEATATEMSVLTGLVFSF